MFNALLLQGLVQKEREMSEEQNRETGSQQWANHCSLFTYYHASYIYIIHGGRERKHYKKTDDQNPSPETAKEATRSGLYIR
jgi:hypothetical protein